MHWVKNSKSKLEIKWINAINKNQNLLVKSKVLKIKYLKLELLKNFKKKNNFYNKNKLKWNQKMKN